MQVWHTAKAINCPTTSSIITSLGSLISLFLLMYTPIQIQPRIENNKIRSMSAINNDNLSGLNFLTAK